MSRIVLSDISRGTIDSKIYIQEQSAEYKKMVEEMNRLIELDLIRRGKVEMAAKSYISI